jgi:hypothetical protein
MKKIIEEALHPIIGMPLWSIGRAGNLEWFAFGEQRRVIDNATKDGEPKIVSDYALHVQCSWRILDLKRVFVASRDRFYPAGDDPYKAIDDFEWDMPGVNRCDERISKLLLEWATNPMIVSAIEADFVGGLKISFDNGYILDIFPDLSLEAELWRFFKPYIDEEHFVVTGRGIET